MGLSDRAPKATYDHEAFISYSHASDGKLAPAVQTALERFGMPWYRRSNVRVFRDQTGLGLTPDLWGEIQERLDRSRCFILLAAPEAARSEWVSKEIQYWVQHRAGDPMMIVLTGGTLDWNEQQNDFDWTRTDALPQSLRQVFPHEPLWADLTWARADADLSLRKPRFFVEIAKIVAGMHGVPLDRVFDEAAVQQRRATRLFRAATAALLVVTVLALGAAIVGMKQASTVQGLKAVESERLRKEEALAAERRNQAAQVEQRRSAVSASQQLASKATHAWAQDRELSTLLAIEAISAAPTPEAERALRKTLVDAPEPLVLRGHSQPAEAEFCADGTCVLTTSSDRSVRLWDAATGKNLRTFQVGGDPNDDVMGVASADGSKVLTMGGPDSFAVGYWESSTPLKLYDAATGKLVTTITDKFAARADLSPDGAEIVVGEFNNSAKIWDAGTGKVRFDLKGHDDRVTSARFSPDGKWAVTTSYDGTARIWNANSGENVAVLRGPKELIYTRALFSPDGEQVLTLGGTDTEKDDVLQLWDWAHPLGPSTDNLAGQVGSISSFGFTRDGKQVVTLGILGQSLLIWDMETGKPVLGQVGFEDPIRAAAVSPNGRWLATVSREGIAQISDTDTHEKLMSLGKDKYPGTSVSFSPDGKHIVSGTTGGEVLLYSLPMLGSADELKALAEKRVKRALTPLERQEYVDKR